MIGPVGTNNTPSSRGRVVDGVYSYGMQNMRVPPPPPNANPQQQPRQEGGSSGVGGASDMDVSSPSSSSSPAAPDGSFSFIWASERSGFMHLYLYQYVPGEDKAVEIRQITSGEWVVEFVVGVDQVRKGGREKSSVW